LRAIFARKLRERQEFIDRYFVFSDRGYTAPVDYSRTRGLVAEILNTIQDLDEEHQLMLELQARPPPTHVPRPPIGATPFDAHDGSETIIIGPEGDEVIGGGEVEVEVPQVIETSPGAEPDVEEPAE